MVGTAGVKWLPVLGAVLGASMLAVVASMPAAAQSADTIARIKETKEIRLAFRKDAAPFSYEQDGKPTGYSNRDLCLENTAAQIPKSTRCTATDGQLHEGHGREPLDSLTQGAADLLCARRPATLSRHRRNRFLDLRLRQRRRPLVDPAGGGPTSIETLGGRKIRRARRTTTAGSAEIGDLRDAAIDAEVVMMVRDPRRGIRPAEKRQHLGLFRRSRDPGGPPAPGAPDFGVLLLADDS